MHSAREGRSEGPFSREERQDVTTALSGPIQLLCAVSFLIVGLSHVLQPIAWARFFVDLRELGTTGIFATALVGLPVGVLIVAFHNVWSGPPVVLTVIGWGYTAKAAAYLIAPALGEKTLAFISADRVGAFRIAGAGLLVLSAYCFALHFEVI